ncbi:TetR/AcrR family transcriptional regulator [Bradyrhizobium liaoningense]|uniref:TetR/AcrR family transcriptional regulator n=1 Tax=Bradyrhizobium liaoningense TaxID=43992 RepID=UPI001BA61B3D|nr:TetR/AcrR family transcriptional regulator [Bradyrhizobium liaoningense]MBR0706993.1 TetR/AcrR family transcriptional regulator [Bradyrhizobium liaoningense]
MPSNTGLKPKVRARRKAERPAEILDAAFIEFAKEGYAATRLEDVAKRVGVTKGTIYFYFETKERVFEEMIRHVARPVFSELNDFATTLNGPYLGRLRALIGFLYNRIAKDRSSREVFRFLIAEGGRFPELVDRHYEEFVRPFIDRLREVVTSGVAAGEFRTTAALEFSDIFMSPILMLNLWTLLSGDRRKIDLEAFIDAHFDLLMNGLSLPKPPRKIPNRRFESPTSS